MKRPPQDARVQLANRTITPDPWHLQAVFDRPGVVAAYLFGSLARQSTNPLSDVAGYLHSQKGGGSTGYVKPEDRKA